MKSRPHDTNTTITIGVISDTHGLLRPEAVAALQGSSLIIHAGDIGAPKIITELESIAPVTAVKGNNDRAPWAKAIPTTQSTIIGRHHIFVIHDVQQCELDPIHTPFRIIVSGHSHKPTATERNGILFLNPGSAGPRRFTLPTTVAQLRICGSERSHEFLSLTK